MANNFLTIDMITLEALMTLENNIVFAGLVNRQFDDSFGVDGAEVGDSINVRVPPKYVGRRGDDMQIEDIKEKKRPIELTTKFGVDINFSTTDLLLHMGNFSKRYLQPACAKIANTIDRDGALLVEQLHQQVGTPGKIPDDLDPYLEANDVLDDQAVPQDETRTTVLAPRMGSKLVSGLQPLFNDQRELSRQYLRGRMRHAAGLEFLTSQNMPTHTYGVGGATAANRQLCRMRAGLSTASPGAASSTLQLDGFDNNTSNVIRKGDILTVEGVDELNPMSYESTGTPKQVRALEDVNSNGSGEVDVQVAPALVYDPRAFRTGNNQNAGVTGPNEWTSIGLPADNAQVTIHGARAGKRRLGVALHRDCFVLVSADLPLPAGVAMRSRKSDPRLGMSIRIVQMYTIATDKMPCRMDVLYGWNILRPEMGVRIAA